VGFSHAVQSTTYTPYNHRMRYLPIFAVVLCVSSFAHAQNARQLYMNNCIACHQADGSGGGAGTSTLLDEEWATDGSYRAQFNAIKQGMPDFGMPGYKDAMNDAQTWAVVNYIQELRHQHHRKQPGFAPARQGNDTFKTDHLPYRIETLIDSGISIPWSVAFLPDGRMLVADRPGPVRVFKDGKLGPPIRGIPEVKAAGQGGMLDVQPHPNFSENGWVYISYSHALDDSRNADAMTRVVRGRLTDDNRWTDQQTIWQAKEEHYSRARQHFGCRLVFDDDNHLFIAIGDRGNKDKAQDLAWPNGKVHRVHDDGKIPADNPFVGQPNAYESIWSFGHRNPQGMTRDPNTGKLWVTEHGPRGGDELNRVQKSENYGWPVVSFGINYSGSPFATPWPSTENKADTDITMPVHVWLPSIAVCGLEIVRNSNLPAWEGDLLAGGLAGNTVDRLRIKDGQVTEVEKVFYGHGRVRDVVQGPDGNIYVVLNGPDKVVRLVGE